MKPEAIETLAKFVKGLASHFHKAASSHDEIASNHDKASKSHSDAAAFHKSKGDACDDGDVMKATYNKMAEHHTAKAAHHEAMHKLHKGLADQHKAMGDSVTGEIKSLVPDIPANKAVVTDPAPTDPPKPDAGIAKMLDDTTKGLVDKALKELDTNPIIQEQIQKIVLGHVQSVLGKTLEAPAAAGVVPNRPTELKRVPRPGEDTIDKAAVPSEYQHLVEVGI